MIGAFSPGCECRDYWNLAKRGIVRRVSVLRKQRFFLDVQLDELKAIPGIELGLHFNVTLRFFPIPYEEEGLIHFRILLRGSMVKQQFVSARVVFQTLFDFF